jgi:lysophospholipase L1-like esterase
MADSDRTQRILRMLQWDALDSPAGVSLLQALLADVEGAAPAGRMGLAASLVADCNGTQGNGTDNAAAVAALTGHRLVLPGVHRVSSLTVAAGAVLTMSAGARFVLDDGGAITLNGRVAQAAMLGGLDFLLPGWLGAVGDSISVRGTALNSATVQANCLGQWIAAYSGGLLIPDPSLYYGAAGTLTSDLDGQITSLLATGTPAACLVISGTNDGSTVTSAQQVSRIVNACFRLLSVGILPLVVSILPRSATISTAIRARNAATNARLGWLLPRIGALYYDGHRVLGDGSSTVGDPLSGTFEDGIHPNAAGMLLLGSAMGADLLSRFGGFYGFDRSFNGGDAYDATLAPAAYCQYVPNPTFAGTGGSLVGSGTATSGQAPNSWVFQRNTGTVVGAIAVGARSAPFANQRQATITIPRPGSGTAQFTFYANMLGPNPGPQGSRVICGMDIGVSGSTAGGGDEVTVLSSVTSGNTGQVGYISSGGFAGDHSGRYFTPPFAFGPAGTTWNLQPPRRPRASCPDRPARVTRPRPHD